MLCFLEYTGHVRELTGTFSSSSMLQGDFWLWSSPLVTALSRRLSDPASPGCTPCFPHRPTILYRAVALHIHESFTPLGSGFLPHQKCETGNTSITWSICRTQAFNFYYFRNWIPSFTLVWLSGKPRSLGLGDLGGILLLEESVPALRTL